MSANWTGQYEPCSRHADLLRSGPLDLAVRFSTSNAALARQFARAMDFWSSIVDAAWHRVDSEDCAIQLIDGAAALFETGEGCGCMAARAQMPDRERFDGWVAFNPSARLNEREMYAIAVHEIGHLLGLPHNPRASSVMFYLPFDDSVSVDAEDLKELGRRHRLRAADFTARAANAAEKKSSW